MQPNKMTTALAVAAAVAASTLAAAAPTGAQDADMFPDEGLPAVPVTASPLVSERTEVLAAGVTGINSTNDSFPNTNIRVAAIAELDGTMYIGGKFTQVEIAATGELFDQPFLAAFDRDTGTWVDTFAPILDGNVWDLKVTPDGNLIVAGQFTNVNGVANTSGVAMIDPTTGAVDPTWRVHLEITGTTDRPIARTLDIDDDTLYIGGNFTKITGTDGVAKSAGRIARTELSTGNADGTFLPDIDGIVFDIDATSDRVYVVGNFHYVNNEWAIGMAPLEVANGQLITDLEPWVRTHTANTNRSFQQAILSLGDEIWQTGSEHSTQVYQQSDYSLLRGFVSDPYGDGQALAHMNGIIYKGSHANDDTYEYADTTVYKLLTGWTSRKPMHWVGAWDATLGGTHDHLEWYPQIGTENGEGGWELFADSTDCLWAGGDFNRGSYDGDVPRYAGGFARFCATDTTPPGEPTNPTADITGNGVNLAWTTSTGDDRGGDVNYEILKNDSVFASYISINTFRDPDGTADDRYFVRAMDYTGNRSATTQVFTAAENDTTRPSTPLDLVGIIEANGDVSLTWTASTDNVEVVDYVVYRNAVEIDVVTSPTALVPVPAEGDHWYQVRARDAAGNESFKTPSTKITIDGPDTERPSTPLALAGSIRPNGDVELTWTASTDDTGVTDYIVYRNGAVIDSVTEGTALVPAPDAGDHYYQVQALDAAGNESFKTSPIKVTIDGPDTTRPSTPQNLIGVQEANDDVTLTWDASTDDTGVTDYIVFRNGVELGTVTDPTFLVPTPGLGTGYYQVRARDAAGNESFKTSPLAFEVSGPDVANPTSPQNLAGDIGADDNVTLTWDASTDNIGVTEYLVYRNGTEVATVTDTTAVVTPTTGANFYQIRALDAAGNQSFKTSPLRIDI